MKNTKKIVSIIMAGILSLNSVMATNINQQPKSQNESSFLKFAGGMLLGGAIAAPATILIAGRIMRSNDTKLIAELNRKLSENGEIEKQRNILESRLKTVEEERSALQVRFKAAEQECNALQEQLKAEQQRCNRLQARANAGDVVFSLQNDLAALRQNISVLQNKIAQKDADYNRLEDYRRRLEEYTNNLQREFTNKDAACRYYQSIADDLRQQLASRPGSASISPYLALLGEKFKLDTIMPRFMEKLKSQPRLKTFLKKIGTPSLNDEQLKDLLKNIMRQGYDKALESSPIAQSAKAMLQAAVDPLKTGSTVDTELDIRFFADLFISVGINGTGASDGEHHIPSPPPYSNEDDF